MAEQFPDIASKLSVPQKLSLFERNRAEAEAKRQRADAETAAVLTDFVKSFDDDEPESQPSNAPTRPRAFGGPDGPTGRAEGGAPRRHFGGAMSRNSGPGSLGPSQGMLSKKRTYDGTRVHETRGIFGQEEEKPAPMDAATAFQASDDEEEEVAEETTKNEDSARRAVPKPTVQLSNLPPGSSTAFIKDLLPENLKVSAVRIVTPQESSGNQSTSRRSISAVVTLGQDTPASDIDSVVNNLQNKYLGWGFYLSLSRHLSSAGLTSLAYSNSSANTLPFGAKQPPQAATDNHSRGRPYGGGHRGGFAPPESYDTPSHGAGRGVPSKIQISVQPPSDINQLKLIHKTVESLIRHGPEFEALLMSRPEVQRDEKWAWIWDSRSQGGVWYRWRLWEIMTGEHCRRSSRKPGPHAPPSFSKVFQGEPLWCAPEASLPYEFTTSLDEFVEDSAYDSSEEDESDDDDNPRKRRRQLQHDGGALPPPVDANTDVVEKAFLNPLHRAKLTHLLSRLPTTQAKLRRGDVARVTIFAIKHASEGAEEIVDMLVGNVLRPLNSSTCGKHEREMARLVDEDRYSRSASPDAAAATTALDDGATSRPESRENTNNNNINHLNDDTKGMTTATDIEMHDSPHPHRPSSSSSSHHPTTQPTPSENKNKKEDTTATSLLSLHLISDILSASSTSGIRHAWRYRSLFESSLRRTHVFARLSRLDREHGWGRLRAEKWKRSLLAVLGLWGDWSVFERGEWEALKKEVEEPMVGERESKEGKDGKAKAKGKGTAAAAAAGGGKKSRWKTVAAAGAGAGNGDGGNGGAATSSPEATESTPAPSHSHSHSHNQGPMQDTRREPEPEPEPQPAAADAMDIDQSPSDLVEKKKQKPPFSSSHSFSSNEIPRNAVQSNSPVISRPEDPPSSTNPTSSASEVPSAATRKEKAEVKNPPGETAAAAAKRRRLKATDLLG